MIDLERFTAIFADEFQLNPSLLTPSCHLVDDLGFDSLELFRAALIGEMLLPGFEVPADLSWAELTFGKLYSALAEQHEAVAGDA